MTAGEHLVVDLDRLGGILGLVAGLGDDGGDRFTDPAHRVARDRPDRRRFLGLLFPLLVVRFFAAAALARGAGERTAVLSQLLAGDHRDDARHRLRRGRVNRPDPGVGVRAAHDRHVRHARDVQVVDVHRRARDQARIFLASYFCADQPAQDHGCPSPLVVPCR